MRGQIFVLSMLYLLLKQMLSVLVVSFVIWCLQKGYSYSVNSKGNPYLHKSTIESFVGYINVYVTSYQARDDGSNILSLETRMGQHRS